ncbi:MAG: hypothetical protein ACXWU5_07210 [Rhodoplanes sp.]
MHHPATELEKLKGNDLNILSGVQLVAGLVPTVKGILDAATSNESIVAKGGGCCVSFQGLADDPTTMTEPTSPPPWFVREPEQAFVLNDASLLARSRDRPHIPERLRPRPRSTNALARRSIESAPRRPNLGIVRTVVWRAEYPRPSRSAIAIIVSLKLVITNNATI